jgi:CRISPR/Cas system-associated exonuclease Cas4 (RecB family)
MHNIDAYERILSTLDANKDLIKKESPAPKVNKKEKKKEDKKEQASINTKKLIEESSYHAYTPPSERLDSKPSEGFDVLKFKSLMRAQLIDKHKRLQSYERPNISVTELTKCLRQCFYERLKYPVDLKKMYQFAYLLLIQQVGDKVHEIILNLYDFSETEKTVVSEKYRVKGRVDAIRDKFLCEIKTIDIEKFKENYLKEHYDQAVIYAHILNTEYDYDIQTITLIYVIRNCKRIVPFDIKVNSERAEELLSKAPILLKSLQTKSPPDPIDATPDQCKYCLYKQTCENDPCDKILQPFAKKENKQSVKKKKSTQPKKEKKAVFLM